MRYLLAICSILLLVSCNKEKYFDGPDHYSDDFEVYSTIDDLLVDNDEKWSFFQLTFDENILNVDSTFAHTGAQSMHFYAAASTEEKGASKCSISKQKMAFYEGETISVEVWYYLVGTASADWLFLFDLEEQAAIGAGPGMRLAMVDNALRVEHKYYNPDILQLTTEEVQFPRNEWVKVNFEAKLSQKKKGSVKVWQNDQLIIHQENWKTLPTDFLYSQQGTKGMYTSIEFGLTANTRENPMELYVDDIIVKKMD
jgi:hypothetical protein